MTVSAKAHNRYGLSRHIPEQVKRLVRQNCGFGCVICGSSIIEYEHVEPEFWDASKHDPSCIALLCPQCHSRVTTGFWSKSKVKEAMKAPFCRGIGYSRDLLDVGRGHPQIVFAGNTFQYCSMPVMVHGLPIFKINEPEEQYTPFRIDAYFCNSRGELSLIIKNNEWIALSANWDVEVKAGTISIRDNPRHISLQLVASPPDGLIVTKLDMKLFGWHLRGDNSKLLVRDPKGRPLSLANLHAVNCKTGLSLG